MGPAVRNSLDAVTAVNSFETSFVNFTTKLVRDTMNALVASAISQMRSYADLVATIERGLGAFRSSLNPQSGSGAAAWIAANLPELSVDATANTATICSGTTTWSATSVKKLQSLFTRAQQSANCSKSLALTEGDSEGKKPLSLDQLVGKKVDLGQVSDNVDKAASLALQINNPVTDVSTEATVLAAINAMLNDEAELAYNELNTLVKMGLYRVVVTDGHILTKCSFNLTAEDNSNATVSDISQSVFSAHANADAGFLCLSASTGTSYSNLKIRVANQSSSASTNITENVTGEVLVNFRGDYFPAASVSTRE